MTITRRTSAGFAIGQLSVSAAYPATVNAGDYLVYLVGFKPSNANLANNPNIATPSGWTALGSLQFAGGYGSTLGADTGNVSIFAFGKVAVGTESGTVSASSGIYGDVIWGEIIGFGKTLDAWDVAATTASDTSAGNLSLGFANSSLGVQPADYLLTGFVMPTNSDDGLKFSGEAYSLTSVTFGTVTEIDEPNDALNNDIGGVIFGGAVSTGTSSTNTLTASATAGGTTTNVRGGGIIVRLREYSTGPITIPGGDRTGSSTPSGSIAGKTVIKAGIAGSSTPGATVAARTTALSKRTGSSTPSGAITKTVMKGTALAGSTTMSGTVTPTRVILLGTKTGSSTPSGLIKPRTVTKGASGTSTPSGSITKKTTKGTPLAGSIAPSGLAPPAHIFNRPKSGSITPSGTFGKVPILRKQGSITGVGTLLPKTTTYKLTSSLAPSGTLAPHRLSHTAMWVGPPKALPDSKVIWSLVTWEEYVPEGASVTVQTSINGGLTWENAVNGQPVPHLKPRTSVARAINYRVLLTKADGTSEAPIVSRLSIDVDTNTSRDELLPQGVFVITDTVITDDADGIVIELDAMDISLLVHENAWESVRTFPAGTNMGDVIKQVLQDRDPNAQFDFASTAMVAPATLTFGASDTNDPLADAQRCAQFCGMELFVDYRGYYVMRAQPDPDVDPLVYTFSDRTNPTMTKVLRRLTRTESFNYIVVSGETTGTTPPVTATVADNDPRSPTYYLGTGGKRVKRIVSKLVTSVADAVTMAQGYLLKLKGAGETIEISAVPNPALTEGDVVGVDRSLAGLGANYLLDAYQIDFGVESDMTWAGRRQKLDSSQASGGSVGGLDGDDGTGTGGGTVTRTYSSPGECLKIGTNGNLNHFKLQAARPSDSAIFEKTQAQIGGGYSESPYFCMTPDNTAVQMYVDLDAPTTSGSSNPRSELRQVDTNGTGTTGFSPAAGYGLQQTFRFPHLPGVNKSCSGMQIHDADDDVLQIKTAKVSGVLKIGYSKNGGSFVALDDYTEGAWVTVRIMYISSTAIDIIYKPGKDYSLAGATTTHLTGVTHSGNCYFKSGTYPQQTSSESSSDYASGEYTRLGSYYPGGPDPVYDSDTVGGSGAGSTFTFAFGACINANASAAGSLTHIKNAQPDYFAVLGDFWYKDGASRTWTTDWTRQMGYSNFAALIAGLPNKIIVGVSDHDFGYQNNSTGVDLGSSVVNAFNSAYRTQFGSSGAGVQGATLPTTGIYRTWVVGRVRFVLLDMLSFKSSLSATDNGSKTMLGSTQKAWYKNILATASEPLIVVLGDGQIPGPKEAGQDEWRGYDTERQELANALNASPRTVIYLNGDTHSLAVGDSQYGYDKCWQSAPLHNTTKVKAGGVGYSQQYPDNDNESDTVVSELYAIVTFTDDGSNITATYRGYEGTEVRITDTLTV